MRLRILSLSLLLGLWGAEAVCASPSYDTVQIRVVDPRGNPFRNVLVALGCTMNGYGASAAKIAEAASSAGSVLTDSNGIATFTTATIDSDLNNAVWALSSKAKSTSFDSFSSVQLEISTFASQGIRDVTAYVGSSYIVDGDSACFQHKYVDSLFSGLANEVSSSTRFLRTYRFDYNWQASPHPTDSGSFTFAGVPYQLLYDPPGNGSSVSLTNASSYQTSVSASFGASAGASLSFGYEWKAPFNIASGSIDISTSVKYSHNTDNNFTAAITQSSTMSQSNGTDSSLVGPGRGDLFLCPSLLMHWQLYRVLAAHDSAAKDSGYVYKLFYSPVSTPSNTDILVHASQLKNYVKDTASLNHILAASAIDPQTHRIRASLLDPSTKKPIGTRLKSVGSPMLIVGGGSGWTQTSDSTVTQSVTVSQAVDLSTEVTSKLTVGGASVGASISAGLTVGWGRGSSTASTRNVSYTIAEQNSWDQIRFTPYLDNAYGVYVFDVDSANSWTSFPFESGYSQPSVALNIVPAKDTLYALPGGIDTFVLNVTNANRDSTMSFNSVSASCIVNSGATVNVDATTAAIAHGSSQVYKVAAGSLNNGTYPLWIQFTGNVKSSTTDNNSYSQSVPLTLAVSNGATAMGSRQVVSPKLVSQGSDLRVECAGNASWFLQVHDLRGRLVIAQSGIGPQAIRLPSASGLVITTLNIEGQRLQQVSSALH